MENIVKREYHIDSQLYKDFSHTLEMTKDTENHVVELCMRWYITFISDIINGYENNGNEFYGQAIRKIPRWASKPEQYNHKIIRAYFTAAEHNDGKATIELMEKLCSDETHKELYVPTFKDNYDQMKFDSKKSNGKVFEDDGNEVWIWEKVKEILLFYKPYFYNVQKYLKETQNNNEVTNMQFYNDTTINRENYTGKVHGLIDTKNIECNNMHPVARKKTMYISADGSMCVFMLRSKFHANQGCWRIDINHTQKDEMQNHKDGIFFFCLDGYGIIRIDFSDIKPFLTEENAVTGARKHGGLHWQLRFSNREIFLNKRSKPYR